MGYSEKEVAAYLGIKNPEIVTRWEKGESMPSTAKLLMLSALYKVLVPQMYPALYKEIIRDLNVKMRKQTPKKKAGK
jgi:transcriptional regulator with XRE-family HTH domain